MLTPYHDVCAIAFHGGRVSHRVEPPIKRCSARSTQRTRSLCRSSPSGGTRAAWRALLAPVRVVHEHVVAVVRRRLRRPTAHVCAGTWIVRSPLRQQEARRVGSGSALRGGRCNSAHVPIRWAVRAEPAGGGKRAGACSHPLGCRGTLRWARHRTAEDTPNEQTNK